jgi:two-component sensor histidine kinase
MMYGIVRRMTLRQRLVALVAIAIVPGLVALLVYIVAFHQERQREVREQALRTSEVLALEMDRIVSGAGSVLETLAVAPAVRTLSPSCTAYLEELTSRLKNLAGLAVFETDGQQRCATAAFASADLGDAPFFREAVRRDGLAVGNYIPRSGTRPPMLPLALRIDAGSGPRVLVTSIDLDWLGARIRDRDVSPGSAVAVAGRDGVILAREPDPQDFVGRPLSEAAMDLARAQVPGAVELMSADGIRRIVGYQPAGYNGSAFFVGVGFSTDVAFAPVNRSTWHSLGLAGAGVVAAFLLAWMVGDRLFRRPIRRILDTVARWRAGDESARIGIAPDAGELSILAAAIDGYMDSLVLVRAERAEAEERRTLLLREMNHRIKNILSAVQAIANQTFRDGGTPETLAVFSDRLAAMATAHDLLVTENWESADLGETVTTAVTPFVTDGVERFQLVGEPVQITAKAALSLSMAIHELCTNAAKYGALSCSGGRVTVSWRLDSHDGGRFHFVWQEEGGPRVALPTRRGFGSRLIETALAGELSGSAEIRYLGGGVRFELDAAADRVLPTPPEAPRAHP